MKETRFKNTEIGLIPEDWEVKTLGEIMSIKSGSSITGESFVSNGKYPVFGGNGVRGFYNSYNIDGEYILIGRVGALCGNIHLTNGKSFASEHALVCYPIKQYTPCFIASLLKRMQLGQYSGASAQPVLAAKKIEGLSIQFPGAKEQEKIGKALSDVDELIDGLKKLIQKKRAIKQGAMAQLLTGKLRLPGFTAPWTEITIKNFTEVFTGATPDTSNPLFWNGDILWMSSGELNDKYVVDVRGRITKAGYLSTSTKMLQKECVLIGLAGQGKTRGTAAINLIELCTNQSIAAILPSRVHNSYFLYHQLDFRYEELRILSSGDTSRGGLTKSQLLELLVSLPCLEEQQAIAKILTDMDKEISDLEAKLKKYEQVKQGMMQQLLTGKIRLL